MKNIIFKLVLAAILIVAVANCRVKDNKEGGKVTIDHKFVFIQGGTFTMGSPVTEVGRNSNEVQHQVTVSSFYMDPYQVTQGEYQAVMGHNPSLFTGDNDRPVEMVSWLDAVEYANALSAKKDLKPAYSINGSNVIWDRSANGYRLPTEAEWEYAARAGTTTTYYTGDTITAEQANINYSKNETTAVGSYAPNPWGLYDMIGNVREWTWDYLGAYDTTPQTDPTGPISGDIRVERGGSRGNYITSSPSYVRSAARGSSTHNANNTARGTVGIRLVLNIQ